MEKGNGGDSQHHFTAVPEVTKLLTLPARKQVGSAKSV